VKVGYGDTATLGGTLTDSFGAPLASRTIILYRKTGADSWRADDEVVTAADGTFFFAIAPTAKVTLFAVYDGNSTTWGDSSGKVVVKVVPDITIAPEGATPDGTGVYRFPAGTTAVTLTGTLAPPHPGRHVVVKVSSALDDGTYVEIISANATLDSQGIYRYVFSVPEGLGSFRATAQFPKDKDHAFSKSLPVYFTVG